MQTPVNQRNNFMAHMILILVGVFLTLVGLRYIPTITGIVYLLFGALLEDQAAKSRESSRTIGLCLAGTAMIAIGLYIVFGLKVTGHL